MSIVWFVLLRVVFLLATVAMAYLIGKRAGRLEARARPKLLGRQIVWMRRTPKGNLKRVQAVVIGESDRNVLVRSLQDRRWGIIEHRNVIVKSRA